MALDRLKLHKALNSNDQHGGKDKIHLWSQEVGLHFKLDSITIKDFGTFDIPFRSEEEVKSIIDKIKELNAPGQDRQQRNSCYKVPGHNILILPHTKSLEKSLNQLIEQAFRKEFGPALGNLRINIDVHMRSLAICQYLENAVKFPLEKGYPDSFGLMLLQLPVGLDSSVSADVRTEHFMHVENLTYQSKHPHHLTIVAGRGNDVFHTTITAQPDDGTNPIVFLVYDLVWVDSLRLLRNPNPKVFLDFLWKLNEIHKALSGWEGVEMDRLKLDCGDNRRCPPSLNRIFNFALLDAQKTTTLCIPTKHSYNSYELQMENLQDADVRTFNSLKAIHFIDVSLGVFRIPRRGIASDEGEKRGPFIDWEKEAAGNERNRLSIDRWTQGDWTFPNAHDNISSLRSNWHLVGDVKSKLDDDYYRPLLSRLHYTYHPAIIIRPRNAAIIDCWNHSPFRTVECLIQRMKLVLSSNYNKEGLERQRLIQDLSFIHSLVIEDKVSLDKCQKTSLLHQLLYLCSRLEAVEEGLKIMEYIPRTQCDCSGPHRPGDLKGFVDENDWDLLSIVLKMVSLAGWERCSSHVYGMFSRREIKDCRHLFKLSRSLEHAGCIDGAITFAKGCLRIHVENEWNMKCDAARDELDWIEFECFLQLIFKQDSTSSIDDEREMLDLLKGNAKGPTVVRAMMQHYICNFEDNEERLSNLKSAIADIVAERTDHFHDPLALFELINFAYVTRNAELAELIWSECFKSEGGKQENECFEEILSDQEVFDMNNPTTHEAFYKAIACSTLAKERFFKFIDEHKRNTESLVRCFFHLTMAQREPRLADREKLQSFISTLRQTSLSSLLGAAEGTVDHNASEDNGLPISQTITSALLDCLLTKDLPSLFYQETDGFGRIMYYAIELGGNFTKLGLLETIKETLLNGNYEESNPINDDATTRLINIWLTCLKMKFDAGDSKRSIIVYQTLHFFLYYFKTRSFYLNSQPTVPHFIGLSDQLTLELLEKFLIALYEREQHQRVLKCLKEDLNLWWISQGLSDLFATHPEMKTAIVDFEAERIVKLTCCIFWLGSQLATREFVDLVCELPCSTIKWCLSLLIVSGDQLNNCAISSPFSFAALQKLICCCMKHSFPGVGYSWARHVTVGCREVDEFYQSEEKSKRFGPFETQKDACNFGAFATKHLLWAAYVINTSENTCEITKLFSAVVDDVLLSSVPYSSKILRAPCNEFLLKNCPIDCVSKSKICTICLTPAFNALHDAM